MESIKPDSALVFYAEDRRVQGVKLVADLRSRGVVNVVDVRAELLLPGRPTQRQYDEMIASTNVRASVLVLSSGFMDDAGLSLNVLRGSYVKMVEEKRPMLLVRFTADDPIPTILKGTESYPFFSYPYDQAVARVEWGITGRRSADLE